MTSSEFAMAPGSCRASVACRTESVRWPNGPLRQRHPGGAGGLKGNGDPAGELPCRHPHGLHGAGAVGGSEVGRQGTDAPLGLRGARRRA
jgi:hypothetical protein